MPNQPWHRLSMCRSAATDHPVTCHSKLGSQLQRSSRSKSNCFHLAKEPAHHPTNSQERPQIQDVASVAKQTSRKWRNGIHLPSLGSPISLRLIDFTSHSQKESSESNLRVNSIVVGLPSPWNTGKHQRLTPTPHSPLTMLPRIAKSIEPPQTLQKC